MKPVKINTYVNKNKKKQNNECIFSHKARQRFKVFQGY